MEWVMAATFRQLPDSQVQINQIVIAKLELKFSSYVPFNKIIKDKSRAIFVLDTFQMVDSIVMDRIIGPDLSTNVWECFYDQGGDFWSIRKLNDLQKNLDLLFFRWGMG